MSLREHRPGSAEVRAWLGALKRIASGKRLAIALTHDNPDPDAMASAAGLGFLLQSLGGFDVTLGYGGIIGRAENQALVRVLRIPMIAAARLDFSETDLVALVDTQPAAGNHSLPDGRVPDIVIDHHPDRVGDAPVSIVTAGYGATSSIVTDLLRVAKVEPPIEIATALFYGVKTDTKSLGREAALADSEAYQWLFPRSDMEMLAQIEHPQVPREYFQAYARAYRRAQVFDRVILVDLAQVYVPDIVPEIAERLVSLQGAKWSVALGEHDDALFISVRTTDRRMNAGKQVRELVTQISAPGATAGGHGQMAGARVPVEGLSRRGRQALANQLKQRFRVQLGVEGVEAGRLV